MSDCPYRDRRECGAGGGAAGVPYWYCLVRHDECEQMPDLLEECKVRLSSNEANLHRTKMAGDNHEEKLNAKRDQNSNRRIEEEGKRIRQRREAEQAMYRVQEQQREGRAMKLDKCLECGRRLGRREHVCTCGAPIARSSRSDVRCGLVDCAGSQDDRRFFCSTCQKFWTKEELVECVPCDPPDGCPECHGCCHELWSANAQGHVLTRSEAEGQ